MLIPEEKQKKIVNGAKYFMDIKPSLMNYAEVLKLHKFCSFILGEEERLTQEQVFSMVNNGQQSLPEVKLETGAK